MKEARHLHVVPPVSARPKKTPEPEQALRRHLRRRKQLVEQLAAIDASIAFEARRLSNKRGLKGLIRIEQLQLEFGA
jgi:hypothetical protein